MSRSEYIVYKSDYRSNDQPLQIPHPTKYYSKYESLKDQIDNLISLNENWDGYGSISVLEEIGQSAKTFLSTLNPSWIERVSDIYPNPHGTLTIEWENKVGEKLSLELGGNNFSYFIKQDDNQPILVDGKDNIPNLKNIESHLDKLFGKDIPRLFLEPRANS